MLLEFHGQSTQYKQFHRLSAVNKMVKIAGGNL